MRAEKQVQASVVENRIGADFERSEILCREPCRELCRKRDRRGWGRFLHGCTGWTGWWWSGRSYGFRGCRGWGEERCGRHSCLPSIILVLVLDPPFHQEDHEGHEGARRPLEGAVPPAPDLAGVEAGCAGRFNAEAQSRRVGERLPAAFLACLNALFLGTLTRQAFPLPSNNPVHPVHPCKIPCRKVTRTRTRTRKPGGRGEWPD